MTHNAVRAFAEFPALVAAAFIVRNAALLIVLSAWALVLLGAE
jgi:hypothetical protein